MHRMNTNREATTKSCFGLVQSGGYSALAWKQSKAHQPHGWSWSRRLLGPAATASSQSHHLPFDVSEEKCPEGCTRGTAVALSLAFQAVSAFRNERGARACKRCSCRCLSSGRLTKLGARSRGAKAAPTAVHGMKDLPLSAHTGRRATGGSTTEGLH